MLAGLGDLMALLRTVGMRVVVVLLAARKVHW